MGKHAQHLAEVAVLGSAAAALDRNAGSQDATPLQLDLVLDEEQVLVLVASRARRKFGAQLLLIRTGFMIRTSSKGTAADRCPSPLFWRRRRR